jgi:hypothetical protein
MRKFGIWALRSPDGDGGGGASDQGGTSVQDQVEQAFKKLRKRFNDDTAGLARQLFNENHDLREKNRKLTEQLPGEGAVVLTKEQASQWAAYQALGSPEAVQGIAQERDSLKSQVEQAARRETIAKAAQAHGFNLAALERLAGDVELELRKDADGKEAAIVKADGKEVALDAYAQEQWQPFLPALQVQQQPDPVRQGVNMVPQRGKEQQSQGDLAQQRIDRMKERASSGNALTKKKE